MYITLFPTIRLLNSLFPLSVGFNGVGAKLMSGLSLEKPVHGSYVHWSSHADLITQEALDTIKAMPNNIRLLATPGCPASAFIAGVLLGAGRMVFDEHYNSYKLKLNLAFNEQNLALMALVCCFFNHTGLGTGYLTLSFIQGEWTLGCVSKPAQAWLPVYELWYPHGSKCLPKTLNTFLTPLSMAVWFMSNTQHYYNGRVLHVRNGGEFQFYCFYSAVERAFGIKFSRFVYQYNNNIPVVFALQVPERFTGRLQLLLQPYLHVCWHPISWYV
jgi:hypothetical protein